MRNLKRVLSLALACVMVIGMMVMTTGAADIADIDEVKNVEAVSVMNALGVLEGDENGVFNPKGILTREQAAKIIAYMKLGPDKAEKLVGTSAFSDVEATRWSAPYIAYCASLDIISGYDGKFNPTGELTDVAFGKMLLVALGYDAEIEGYVNNDNWATNIGTDMIEARISNGAVTGTAVTREDAAQLAFNTLTATMVGYTGGMSVSTSDGTTVTVGSNFGTKYATGYDEYLAEANAAAGNDGDLQFCEKHFPNLKLDKTGETDAYGFNTKVWYVTGGGADYTLVATGAGANVVSEVIIDKVVATYTDTVADVTDDALFTLFNTTTVPVIENGQAGTSLTIVDGGNSKQLAKYAGAKVEAVSTNADGYAETLIVTYSYLAKVTNVTPAEGQTKRSIELTVYNKTNGTAAVDYTTDEFAKGDLLLVTPKGNMAATTAFDADADATGFEGAGNILAIEPVAGTVSGKATYVPADGSSITLAGTEYPAGATGLAFRGNAAGSALVQAAGTFTVGTDYILVMNNGYVFGYADAAARVATIDSIVYVTRAEFQMKNELGEESWYVEAVSMDGTSGIYCVGTTDPNVTADQLYKITKNNATGLYSFSAPTAFGAISATDPYGVAATNAVVNLRTNTTNISATTAGTVFVGNDVALLTVTGEGSTLKTSCTIGLANVDVASGAEIIVTKAADNTFDVVAIVLESDSTALGDISADVIYFVDNTADATTWIDNSSVDVYEGYNLATGKKVEVATSTQPTAAKFYTYSVDANGEYTLTDKDAVYAAAPGADNANGLYTFDADDATGHALTLARNLLTFTDSDPSGIDFAGLDATDAVMTKTVNDNTIKDIGDIDAAGKDAKIYVNNGKVVFVLVVAP